MRQLAIVLLLLFFIIPFSYTLNAQSAYAQKTTATATMTLVSSMGNKDNNTEANASPLENKTVIYHENATGYLVYPSSDQTNQEKKLPAIVMIHENKGLNDYIKDSRYLGPTGVCCIGS